MSVYHLVCVIFGLITPLLVASKHVQFYRKDYTYVKDYDAFYKVHWDVNGLTWSSAFNECYEEGAKLFYPSGDEWTIIKNLTDAMPVAPNNSEIYVGLHNEFNLGQFITIDGKPTESPLNLEDDVTVGNLCILMDYLTGQFRVSDCYTGPETNITPFVCKKVDDESCPTIDHEYKYMKNKNKCYKVNHIEKTWQAAMQTCFMEGGILAVVETSADVPDLALKEGQEYYVGFRKMFSSQDFYTVKGTKFDIAIFKNQYYNANNNDDCGVMQYYNNNDKRIMNKPCDYPLPFICEMNLE